MSCFHIPYIGIKGHCNRAETATGLMINDLAGITLEKLASSATDADMSGQKFFERLERRAIDITTSDFISMLGKYFQWNTLYDIALVGRHKRGLCTRCEAEEFRENEGISKGIEVRITTYDPHIRGRINKIWINTDSEGDAVLKVEQRGREIASLNICVKPGENEIDADILFSDCAVIYLQASDISTAKGECYHYYCNNKLWTRGVYFSGTEWLGSPDYNGISAQISLECEECLLLKPFEKLLGNAVLYQLGVLFMHEILNSDNLDNLFLKNSKDQARANILLWAGGFDRDNMYYKKKGAYHDELRKAVDRARKNLKDGLCLSCNNTRVVFSKP